MNELRALRLRVLSYNIHKGFSIANRRFVLDRIRDAIKAVDADLVFLQEVLGHHDEHASRITNWPARSQFEYLADEIWPHFAYGRNSVYVSGHHGNAVLSKYPIVKWNNHDVSTNSMESRGILHVEVKVPDAKHSLHGLCVHLNLMHGGRKRQLADLAKLVQSDVKDGCPLLIAGDFNDWSARASDILESALDVSEIHRALTGSHAPTFPSRYPVLPLDRIFYRGMVPIAADVLSGTPWNSLSDHAALLTELAFPLD